MKAVVWNFCASCNFKCPYCFITGTGWKDAERQQGPFRSPEEIGRAWKTFHDVYGRCTVYITGGEPFLYPRFNEVVSAVAACHRVHITSNLSQPLELFIAGIDRGKVELNATFHPRFMELETFVRQVLLLRSSGFTCGTCYLAHPSQLREMLPYRWYMKKAGIDLAITPFRGSHEGIEYPSGYTSEEAAFLSYVEQWSPAWDDEQSLAHWLRLRQMNRGQGDNAFNGINDKGTGGDLFAEIAFDGSVRFLNAPSAYLGNLFSGKAASSAVSSGKQNINHGKEAADVQEKQHP